MAASGKFRHRIFLLTTALCSLGGQHLRSSQPLRPAVGVPALTQDSAPCCGILACHWKSFSADAFFKAAIGLVPEVPKTISIDGKLRPSEPFLLEFLCNFFSTLLIVPDHPEHGVLFLVRELLNVIQDYTWEDSSDDKIRIYTSVLHLLSAMSQDTYLYHIDKVDSNDSLYGGDSKFLAENSKLCEAVMAQILEHLKTLAKDEALKRQSLLGLSFFNSILAHGDLRNNKLNQLSVNLWHLAQRHGCADTRTMVKTLDYIKKRSKQPDMNHLSELALRLPLQTRT